jgi:hypothetical protein
MLKELGEDATMDIAEAKRVLANYDAKKRQSDAEAAAVRLDRERLDLQKARGEVMLREEVHEQGLRASAVIVAELASLCDDMPGQLEGLPAVSIRAKLAERIERMKTAIKEQLRCST